jgi:hypothetical protein
VPYDLIFVRIRALVTSVKSMVIIGREEAMKMAVKAGVTVWSKRNGGRVYLGKIV